MTTWRGDSDKSDGPLVLDHAALLARVEGDQELLSEVVRTFQAESPKMLAALESEISCGDAEAVSRAAHLIKGTLQTLGANAAGAAASRLEQLGKDGTLDDAREAFILLSRELTLLAPALSSLIDAPSASLESGHTTPLSELTLEAHRVGDGFSSE